MPLVPAPPRRTWMDKTGGRAAYHCLPMVMANQSGWFILNPCSFVAQWSGADDPAAVKVFYLEGAAPYGAVSSFGHGILTFLVPFLFRTPANYNLLVRGPANCPKDGASPLEGLVESDWSAASFTMNWQLTRPHHTVSFEKGEPIAMIVPCERGLLERFQPSLVPIGADTETADRHSQWAASRRRFIASSRFPTNRPTQNRQGHYSRGIDLDGTRAAVHQRSLRLEHFVEAGTASPSED